MFHFTALHNLIGMTPSGISPCTNTHEYMGISQRLITVPRYPRTSITHQLPTICRQHRHAKSLNTHFFGVEAARSPQIVMQAGLVRHGAKARQKDHPCTVHTTNHLAKAKKTLACVMQMLSQSPLDLFGEGRKNELIVLVKADKEDGEGG